MAGEIIIGSTAGWITILGMLCEGVERIDGVGSVFRRGASNICCLRWAGMDVGIGEIFPDAAP